MGTPVEVAKRDADNDLRITKCVAEDFKVSEVSLDLTTADPWVPTVSAGNVAITFLDIPGITLPITSLAEHTIVAIQLGQVGYIERPSSPAAVEGNIVTTSFSGSPLSVFSTSHAAFSRLVAGLVNLGDATVTLRGRVDATFNLGALGSDTLSDIGYVADSPFKGLGGLKVIGFVELIGSNTASNKLTITAKFNIKSPSDISFKLGTVVFVASIAAGDVGTTTFNDLSLVPGDNLVSATIVIDLSLPAGAAFNTALQTTDCTLTLKGSSSSSANVALIPALTAIQTSLAIPKHASL
ncbi:hypothetical protein BGZ74_011650 [Mortierella antarctica]|nr:hypothetical protein BGZ74_011650 [Mortierella antarctica]